MPGALETLNNMMKKSICLYIFLLYLSFTSVGKDGDRTRLMVGVVVSHFHPEWLQQYSAELPAGGFKRLMESRASTLDYTYYYSQTGVDHASIYTGMLPASHGIISHAWYDRLRKRRQENVASSDCVEVGKDGLGVVKSFSPDLLEGIALGDALKIRDAGSKVFSMAMNGEEAVLCGGHAADMALWYSEESGEWITSSHYAGQLPTWLSRFNYTIDSDFFVHQGWISLPRQATGDALKTMNRQATPTGFYYNIVQTKKRYNTYRMLKATPHANTLVRALANELITSEELGCDDSPDLLAINFSCLDYMHRDFTVDSEEFRDVVLRLDEELRLLFDHLDSNVGAGNYTLFFTFSEAREILPGELEQLKIQGGYFSVVRAIALTRSYLGLLYGDGDWITDYDQGQLYLNHLLINERGIDPREIQDRVAAMLADFEGVDRTMTAYALARAAAPQGAAQRMQHSFHPKRGGDVLFSLLPGWIGESKGPEDAHCRHSKRSIVPLYIYGANTENISPGRYTVSHLLSLLCNILDIPPPYTVDL
jgi:hypothetical protein